MVSKLQIILFYRQNRLHPRPLFPAYPPPNCWPCGHSCQCWGQTNSSDTIFDVRSHTNSHNTLVLLETGYSPPLSPPQAEQESHTFWITLIQFESERDGFKPVQYLLQKSYIWSSSKTSSSTAVNGNARTNTNTYRNNFTCTVCKTNITKSTKEASSSNNTNTRRTRINSNTNRSKNTRSACSGSPTWNAGADFEEAFIDRSCFCNACFKVFTVSCSYVQWHFGILRQGLCWLVFLVSGPFSFWQNRTLIFFNTWQ